MAWLWNSWEEFSKAVQPVMLQKGAFYLSQSGTLLESTDHLLSSLRRMRDAVNELEGLGFGAEASLSTHNISILDNAYLKTEEAVLAGERLLLYHKPLALSVDAYGFLSQHSLVDSWDRYKMTRRIWKELPQFVADAKELLNGYHRLERADQQFIIGELDLPDPLREDFLLVRDLFSVGCDEVGLLVAGRGLEGVLRQIARDRKLAFEHRNKAIHASEADFFDLVEVISRMRWKANRALLISRQTKTLLHFLRTIRNNEAHPQAEAHETTSSRDTAKIVANTAGEIWRSVSGNRARFENVTIQKDW